ncbi:Inner membrane protein yedI [Dermatophilus congolensis]|uniref:Inner membrane protein yedI n=1 Tax=Dermatophilus congolensis TaxID=1863 RepID=A0AA46H1C0_9MICO|nr:DUF808 domain-containing protein [Dermatophilus congolensis]STD14494.1 Inner membrane protein yedI [Dermatophilus congolensis]
MAAGLVALLDDVAMLAKLAAASIDDVAAAAGKASIKAAGVVVDDTAVTPRYVTGFTPDRELPAIWRIAKGSLVNKIVFILPAILILSQFAPFLLTPLLMLGGLYLSFEGAEKIWDKVTGYEEEKEESPAVLQGPETEDKMVKSAIRTDFILSAEIMVISLNEVVHQTFWERAIILVVVALLITAGVYGFVGLLVKMDDIGIAMTTQRSGAAQTLGRALVTGMPKVLAALGAVGTVAMLWVGGHILLSGAAELGLAAPYAVVHHLEGAVTAATGPLGGPLGWVTNTAFSALAGLIVGVIVVLITHLIPGKTAH